MKKASHITKLPKGKHSVKGMNAENAFCSWCLELLLDHLCQDPHSFALIVGLGRTAPDPSAAVSLEGVQVPLGKGVHTNIDDTSLLYNEYPLTPATGRTNHSSCIVFAFLFIVYGFVSLQRSSSQRISRHSFSFYLLSWSSFEKNIVWMQVWKSLWCCSLMEKNQSVVFIKQVPNLRKK